MGKKSFVLALVLCASPNLYAADANEETTLRSAVKADPNSEENHLHLGDYYYAQNRLEEANEQFSTALALNPENGEAAEMKQIVDRLLREKDTEVRDNQKADIDKRRAARKAQQVPAPKPTKKEVGENMEKQKFVALKDIGDTYNLQTGFEQKDVQDLANEQKLRT